MLVLEVGSDHAVVHPFGMNDAEATEVGTVSGEEMVTSQAMAGAVVSLLDPCPA